MKSFSIRDFERLPSSNSELRLREPVESELGLFTGSIDVETPIGPEHDCFHLFSELAHIVLTSADAITSLAVAHARLTRRVSANSYLRELIPEEPVFDDIKSSKWTRNYIVVSDVEPPGEGSEPGRLWQSISIGVNYEANDGLTFIVESGRIVRVNGCGIQYEAE